MDSIATFANAKATEMVYKKKVRRSDDKFYYDVCTCVCVSACVFASECMCVVLSVCLRVCRFTINQSLTGLKHLVSRAGVYSPLTSSWSG